MGERRTITVALNEPREKLEGKEYKTDKYLWNFTVQGAVTDDLKALPGKKGQFVCFSKRLVEAFYKAELAGVEHEYVVQVDNVADDQSLKLLEIPSVYVPKSGDGWGAGRSSGPLFSNRQVALLANAIRGGERALDVDAAVAWLESQGSAGDGDRAHSAGVVARRAAPTSDSQPTDPPATPVMLKRLRSECERTGRSLAKIVAYYQADSAEALLVSQVSEALRLLEGKKTPAASTSPSTSPDDQTSSGSGSTPPPSREDAFA